MSEIGVNVHFFLGKNTGDLGPILVFES